MVDLHEVDTYALAAKWATWLPDTLLEPEHRRYTILELTQVHDFMAGFEKPWDLAGGTALDLSAGWLARSHKDTDVVIEAEDAESFYAYSVSRGYEFFGPEGVMQGADGPTSGRHNAFLHRIRFDNPGPEGFEVIFRQRDEHGNVYFSDDHSLVFPAHLFDRPRRIPLFGGRAVTLQPDDINVFYKIHNGARKDAYDAEQYLKTQRDWSALERLRGYIRQSIGQFVMARGIYEKLEDALSVMPSIWSTDKDRFAATVDRTLKEQKPMITTIISAAEISNEPDEFLKNVKACGLGPMELRSWELGRAACLFADGMQPEAYVHYEAHRRLLKLAMDTRVWYGTVPLAKV